MAVKLKRSRPRKPTRFPKWGTRTITIEYEAYGEQRQAKYIGSPMARVKDGLLTISWHETNGDKGWKTYNLDRVINWHIEDKSITYD